jgi:dnd system-associated protein 4
MLKSIFLHHRNVYWPEEYEGVVEFLAGQDGLFKFNTGVITFAATIGLAEKYKKKLEGKRKEIAIGIFENHKLTPYIYMIALASESELNLDLMRNEAGEETTIRIFEAYAAGGLSILNDRRNTGGLKSAYLFAYDLLRDYDSIGSGKGKGKKSAIQKSAGVKDIGIDLDF